MTARTRIRLWLTATTLAFSIVTIQVAVHLVAVVGQRQALSAASSDLSALSRFDARLAGGHLQPTDPAWAAWQAIAGPAGSDVERARLWLDRIDHVVLGSASAERSGDLRWYVRKAAAELRAASATLSNRTASSWSGMARGLLMAYVLLFAGVAGWYALQVIPSRGATIVTTPAAAPRQEQPHALPGTSMDHVRHELRTPLTVMLGYAAELENLLEGELKTFATAIRESGTRLHGTLEQLLAFSELSTESGPLRSEPVEVHEIVEGVIRQIRPSAFDKRLQFVYRATPEQAWVLANADALRSVVSHLAQNAVKFTDRGTVSVSVDADARRVRISVEDTGQGFEETRLAELSAPFVQGSTGDARRHEGVGLGLTIARRVAESGGGRLTASSIAGEGSRFTITLPRHVEDVKKAA